MQRQGFTRKTGNPQIAKGGLRLPVARRWRLYSCAVHRLGADGYGLGADGYGLNVATCRQTVEALLAPLSTAWQRMATA